MVKPSSISPQSRRDGHADGKQINNKLLLDLPPEESRVIFPRLVFIRGNVKDVLNEVGEPITHAFFLDSGLASVLNIMEEGKTVEVGLLGKEGFVGVWLMADFEVSPNRVIMQIEGDTFRISASALREALKVCPVFAKRLLRFSHMMAAQSMQVAACNRVHNLDERLSRWLLMSQDRIESDVIPLTQEFLSHMLGSRRSGVTIAAGALQKAGIISYSRGQVKVLDRSLLEKASCECYTAMLDQG
jgi:CRP-like cAMP-binding protein